MRQKRVKSKTERLYQDYFLQLQNYSNIVNGLVSKDYPGEVLLAELKEKLMNQKGSWLKRKRKSFELSDQEQKQIERKLYYLRRDIQLIKTHLEEVRHVPD